MADLKGKLETKAAANSVAKSGEKSMKDWIKAMGPAIEKALPAVITPDRFTRMALTAISVNPTLAECSPQSFMGALMNAAQLGLEPNTSLGQAYLIPYKNKGKLEVQFQLGYRGMIELAHRSGEFQSIMAYEVYTNDQFDYEYGLDPKLTHKPAMKDRGEVFAYYAVYRLKNGGHGFVVMSIEDVQKHAKETSQSASSPYSPWSKHFHEMAKKTVIKKVLKYAPLKVEFVREISQDETVKSTISEQMTDEPDENVFDVDFNVVEVAVSEEKV